ncbi:DUF742 domain-containing protein [Nocardia farcinica]|uniref:DUF742 domain-containing protein n=1 Tax=Nocardia farcinica TaxID=37329 RepID=UPI0024566CC6|nr:DUF742 domain-containing protein [Nocardia farcinica]
MSRHRRDPDLVRAYVRTGGRSRPTRDLDLVTLVVAASDPPTGARAAPRRGVYMWSPPGARGRFPS